MDTRSSGVVMRTLCAWCQAEGKETVLKDGPVDGPLSHGICPAHEEKLLKDVVKTQKRASNPRRRRR